MMKNKKISKLKKLDIQVNNINITKNYKPFKPIPPTEPYTHTVVEPKVNAMEFLIILFFVFIIVTYLFFIFLSSTLIQKILTSILITIIIQIFNFKKERKNTKKNKEYNEKRIFEYKKKVYKYENDLIEYESKLLIYNELEITKKMILKGKENLETEMKILIEDLEKECTQEEYKNVLINLYNYRYSAEYNIKISTNKMNTNKEKAINYISKLANNKKENILNLLKEVEKIQNSKINNTDKIKKIKKTLWTDQSPKGKLFTGAFIGTLFGLMIFGTGGIGIAGLGSAIGVWGFLAGTTGGILISSIIQNFEK